MRTIQLDQGWKMEKKQDEIIQELMSERDQLIRNNPELERIQSEIDYLIENTDENAITRSIEINKKMLENLNSSFSEVLSHLTFVEKKIEKD